MRITVAIACCLFWVVSGVTKAQCPQTCGKSLVVVAPAQSCCPLAPPMNYTQVTNHLHCSPVYTQIVPQVDNIRVVTSYPVVEINSIAQNYPATWSVVNAPTVYSAAYQSVGTAPMIVNQYSAAAKPNGCGCSAAQVAPQFEQQGIPQTASVLEKGRNPFSLAGYDDPRPRPRPSTPIRFPCQQQFIECCSNKGEDCLQQYHDCSLELGEPMKHNRCPE